MIRTLLGATALALVAGTAPAATLSYTAVLTGAQENPPVATSATGTATFTVDSVTRALGLSLDVTGISLAQLLDRLVAAPGGPVHLHNAPRGSNGPIVIPFAFDTATYADTATGFALNVSGYSFSDAVALSNSAETFDAFVAGLNAGSYYVNVHTDLAPGGEVRGQLAPVPLPAGALLVLTALGALGLARRRKPA